jgi:hypothetical protein
MYGPPPICKWNRQLGGINGEFSSIPVTRGRYPDNESRRAVCAEKWPEAQAEQVVGVHVFSITGRGRNHPPRRGQAPESEFHLSYMQAAARDIGQQFIILNASSERDIDNAFAALLQERTGALIVSTDPFLFSRYHQIVVLAAYHKLPTIYDRREFVAAGGLISYGTHLPDAFRQIGVYVGKILMGTKPSDLPVIQPTKYELVINLKTAKALGLEVPDRLLALADEVIE